MGLDGTRFFCDDGYEEVKNLIDITRKAAKASNKRVAICLELRCK